jgi:hypothetical protein
MAAFYTGTMNPKMALGNVGLMVPVMSKHKMPLMPHKAKGADEVGRIYKKTMAKAAAREEAELKALAGRKAAAEAARAAKPAGGHGAAPATAASPGNAGSEVAE